MASSDEEQLMEKRYGPTVPSLLVSLCRLLIKNMFVRMEKRNYLNLKSFDLFPGFNRRCQSSPPNVPPLNGQKIMIPVFFFFFSVKMLKSIISIFLPRGLT